MVVMLGESASLQERQVGLAPPLAGVCAGAESRALTSDGDSRDGAHVETSAFRGENATSE